MKCAEDGKDERVITSENAAWLETVSLAEPEVLKVFSEDGTPVQAWVMRPPGSEGPVPTKWREKPETTAELGRMGMQAGGHPHLFPNMWITGNQVILRLPKGPHSTEHWFFTLIDQGLTEEERDGQRNGALHGFGPAGFWEQDDGENWGQSTSAMSGVISRTARLHYAMNLGRGQVVEEEDAPPYIESGVAEHAQLWITATGRTGWPPKVGTI